MTDDSLRHFLARAEEMASQKMHPDSLENLLKATVLECLRPTRPIYKIQYIEIMTVSAGVVSETSLQTVIVELVDSHMNLPYNWGATVWEDKALSSKTICRSLLDAILKDPVIRVYTSRAQLTKMVLVKRVIHLGH
jgi:hypothetical protein